MTGIPPAGGRPTDVRSVSEHAETELRHFWDRCGLDSEAWPAASRNFRRLRDLVGIHNAEAGLMGPGWAEHFHTKHVADSLALLLACGDLLAGNVVAADVGSGAGLPGIVLAIACPLLRLTAIESNAKKARFVALAAARLGLGGRVEVVARRSREVARQADCRRRFQLVVARAVAPAGKLIRDCHALIAPGGSAFFYKTPRGVNAELPLARREAAKHKLAVETSQIVELPGGAGSRQFIRIIAPGPT